MMHMSRAEIDTVSRKADYEALPLPRNFFPRVNVSAAERQDYLSTARALLDDALSKLSDSRERGAQLRSWKELGSHGGFRRFAKRVAGGDQQYRIEGTARTSLNNLMGALFADTTAHLRARRTNLFRDLLDAQTLAVLQPRAVSLEAAAQEEHLALRWQAVSLSAQSATHQWDMCFLEYTGVATDNEGFPVGFHISHSIDRLECGLLTDSYGLTRLRGTEVMLLFPTRTQGHTEIVLDGVWHEPEHISTWVVQNFLATASSCFGKLALVVQERLLARLPLRAKNELVPPGDRKSCNVCFSKFGVLGKKSNCRCCGEVVCKSCVVTRNVGESAKFCKKCLVEVSNQREVENSHSELGSYSFIEKAASVDHRSSSSGSRSRHHRDSEASSAASVASASGLVLVPSGKSGPPLPRKQIGDGRPLYDSYGYSLASTASVSSYDSFSESVTDRSGSEVFPGAMVDEDGVLVVSTRNMNLGGDTPSSRRGGARQVPSVQAVEDSIAHQRFILQEMISTARTYQTQQQTRTYNQYDS